MGVAALLWCRSETLYFSRVVISCMVIRHIHQTQGCGGGCVSSCKNSESPWVSQKDSTFKENSLMLGGSGRLKNGITSKPISVHRLAQKSEPDPQHVICDFPQN